jgi:hypothetical protein
MPHVYQVKEKGILFTYYRRKESPLPMTTITELNQTLQALLTSTADTLAKKQASSDANAK